MTELSFSLKQGFPCFSANSIYLSQVHNLGEGQVSLWDYRYRAYGNCCPTSFETNPWASKASTEGVRGAVLRPAVRVPVPSALSPVSLARCDQGLRVRWQNQAHVANWVRAWCGGNNQCFLPLLVCARAFSDPGPPACDACFTYFMLPHLLNPSGHSTAWLKCLYAKILFS